MAAFYNDRQGEALAIDEIITSMRRVIDQLTAAERKRILSSIRSKWSDIADRLEAPSSRNHYATAVTIEQQQPQALSTGLGAPFDPASRIGGGRSP